MLRQPLLVVLAGRPGTGKTTLGQALASELRAAFLRIDAIETAVVRCGLAQPPVGPVGYAVAHEIAAATLALGTPVVIDAVNPVPEARQAGGRSPRQHDSSSSKPFSPNKLNTVDASRLASLIWSTRSSLPGTRSSQVNTWRGTKLETGPATSST